MQERLTGIVYQLALSFFVVYLVVGCTRVPLLSSRTVPDYWPTRGWQSSTPEQQGMDSNVLADALDYVGEQDLALHSLLIVRHGYVVLDAYFYPYTGETVHDVASVTKSITSSIIGIAFEKGYIKDLNRSVFDFFPELHATVPDADRKSFTIWWTKREATAMGGGFLRASSPACRRLKGVAGKGSLCGLKRTW